MTALSVNVNKIAWLRNSREGSRPSVVDAARTIIARRGAGHHRAPRVPTSGTSGPDDVHVAGEVPGLGASGHRVQHRGKSRRRAAGQRLSGVRPSRRDRPPAPGDAGSRQRRPAHLRSRLGPVRSRRSRTGGGDDCPLPGLGRAREPVHGPGRRADRAREGVRGEPHRALYRPVRRPRRASRAPAPGRPRLPAVLSRRHALRDEARSRRQRRARSEPRQSRRLHRHRRNCRGLHRPCADCGRPWNSVSPRRWGSISRPSPRDAT